MHPARWLEGAFGSGSRVRILRLLLAAPARSFAEREIAQAVGMSPNTVNLALRKLAEEDLVHIEPVGNAHAVRLAAAGPMLDALRTVFEAEGKVWEAAKASIRQALPRDAVCYLYGSSTTGRASGDSDVDLLIVTKDRGRAAEVAYAVEFKIHRCLPAKLHIIALDAREAIRRAKSPGIVQEATKDGILLSKRSLDDLVSA